MLFVYLSFKDIQQRDRKHVPDAKEKFNVNALTVKRFANGNVCHLEMKMLFVNDYNSKWKREFIRTVKKKQYFAAQQQM